MRKNPPLWRRLPHDPDARSTRSAVTLADRTLTICALESRMRQAAALLAQQEAVTLRDQERFWAILALLRVDGEQHSMTRDVP